MNNFNKYRENVYSQNGEDGVLREILFRLSLNRPSTSKNPLWCVEFGAWDGKQYSNTFSLIKAFAWNAVYIEGDRDKFTDLQKTCMEYPTIHAVNVFVDYLQNSPYLLDRILNDMDIFYTY